MMEWDKNFQNHIENAQEMNEEGKVEIKNIDCNPWWWWDVDDGVIKDFILQQQEMCTRDTLQGKKKAKFRHVFQEANEWKTVFVLLVSHDHDDRYGRYITKFRHKKQKVMTGIEGWKKSFLMMMITKSYELKKEKRVSLFIETRSDKKGKHAREEEIIEQSAAVINVDSCGRTKL